MGAGWSIKWPDMFLSAKSPGSCQHQIEHGLGQDAIICLAVCSFVPHLQAAVEAIPHLCISEWNGSIPVRRQLSLTHADLEKLIPGALHQHS